MGFWSTLGKIGLIAGGGIATALTAGAASPLLATAIGAGIGAGTGAGTAAIDHKNIWKGMATGAALGGATGGIGTLMKGAQAAKGGLESVSGLTGEGANIVSSVTPGIVDAAKATGVNMAARALGGVNPGVTPGNDPEGGDDPAMASPSAEGPYVQASDGPGIVDRLKAAGLQLVTDPKTGKMDIKRIVNAAGDTAGAVAQGMAAGRDKEVINANAVNNMDIAQRTYGLTSRGRNYQDALRSAFAMNVKDPTFARPAGVPDIKMQGGAKPSALGLEGLLAARTMNAQAQKGLENPATFNPLPDTKAGKLENTLGTAGAITKGIGQITVDQNQSMISDLVKQLLAKQQAQDVAPKADTETEE
jgi:hypothetical protein